MPLPPVAPSPTPTTLEISTPSASTASSFPPPLAAFGDCAYSPPAAMRSQNGGLCLPITHQGKCSSCSQGDDDLDTTKGPSRAPGRLTSPTTTTMQSSLLNLGLRLWMGGPLVGSSAEGVSSSSCLCWAVKLAPGAHAEGQVGHMGSHSIESLMLTVGLGILSLEQPFYRIFDAYCWPGYFVTGVDMHVSVTCSIRRLWLISSLCTYYEAQLRSAI